MAIIIMIAFIALEIWVIGTFFRKSPTWLKVIVGIVVAVIFFSVAPEIGESEDSFHNIDPIRR